MPPKSIYSDTAQLGLELQIDLPHIESISGDRQQEGDRRRRSKRAADGVRKERASINLLCTRGESYRSRRDTYKLTDITNYMQE